MSELRISEQISFLRKQKELTQEELAKALGVTNQAVSKWESGVCCPDIQLLPDIASFFGVSVDELLGYSANEDIESISLKIKDLFKKTTPGREFKVAFQLAVLIHKGILYSRCQFDFDRISEPDDEKFKHGRVMSICTEPEGSTMYCGNGVFFSDQKYWNPMTSGDIKNVYSALDELCDTDVLKVMYALFELTVVDFKLFVSVGEISKKSHVSEEAVRKALDRLPVQVNENNGGELLYRLESSFMYVPSLLRMMI